MAHYPKKLKKYSKNNKSLTKRRFRRKKSIRNKKLHGGLGERTLTATAKISATPVLSRFK
jgi:hypothetical protein